MAGIGAPTDNYSTDGSVADTISGQSLGWDACDIINAQATLLNSTLNSVVHSPGTLTSTPANSALTAATQSIPKFPDAVRSGLALTHNPSTTDQLEFGYALGTAQIGDTVYSYAADSVSVGAGDATDPRIDLICAANSDNSVVVVAGTPAANPVPPAIPASRVPLAVVYVPANAVAAGSDITYDEQSYLTPTLRGLPAAPGVGAVAFWDGTKWQVDATLKYDATNKILDASAFGQKGKALVNSSGNMALSAAFERVDSSGGVIARTMPAFATVPDDFVFTVKRLGANNVTVATDAANAFDEGATASPYTIAVDGDAVSFRKEASQNTWYVL